VAALFSVERVVAALVSVALFSAVVRFAAVLLAANSPGFDVAAIGGLP
jgi:hypothetical protein